MTSVVIMDVWKHFGFFMVILLAAMQSIPRSIVEAAWLDGARPLQVFLCVKVPMIAPVILFCVTYATITGLQMFETVRILTSGGPGDATISLVMYMYEQTFSAQDIGAGTSAALVLLIAIMIVTYIQIRLGRRVCPLMPTPSPALRSRTGSARNTKSSSMPRARSIGEICRS